ncbi:ATP-binding protein [Leclercia sp. UBA2479]|uniref:ATP-binding protein n=1 Tax=Leclercia sp. UBA2479 TaxID=1946738 RepID=UPI0025795AB3|nr:ATP-binding protein [Leclercia sp. UBA2479]
MKSSLSLPASLTSISQLAEWLAQLMAPLPVNDEWRFALDLAVCETATNIIRYALHEDENSRFDVDFITTASSVTLHFTDAGDPFPAGRLADARNESFQESDLFAESGRGLKLILLSVDTFQVERVQVGNFTTLQKFYAPELVVRK